MTTEDSGRGSGADGALIERIEAVLRTLGDLSPAVTDDAPLGWVPGMPASSITVDDDRVDIVVVCRRWPVLPLLHDLRDQVSSAAADRRVSIRCVDVVPRPEPD